MRRTIAGLLLTISGFGALVLSAMPAAAGAIAGDEPRAAGVYAFVNVNVVPMDEERVLMGYTVVVRGDRIVAMGPAGSVEIPSDAVRIDGAGKYLMPGLAEMHGHTPVPNGDPTTQFVNDMMFLYAANGVTTVRGMLGARGQLELKRLANGGEIVGPTLYLAGPSFSGGTVESPEQAAQRVRDQKREGWDLLKVHPGLTAAEFDAMARTAAEVGIRFGGHVPADVGLIRAIEMGQQTFDHIDGYTIYLDAEDKTLADRRKLEEIVELTRKTGAWVVPTMVLWENGVLGLGNTEEMQAWPEMKYWPPNQVEAWANRHRQGQANADVEIASIHARNRNQILKALSDGGAGILMGTDSPQLFSVPGFSLHREMQAMAEAGMNPWQVLVSGTRNVGEYFQAQDSFGTIAPGRRADLLLLEANPLDSVANVARRAGVMVRGHWMTEAEIQVRLEEIATGYAGG
jgi:imidazolonepropionase-like amidohydrolase